MQGGGSRAATIAPNWARAINYDQGLNIPSIVVATVGAVILLFLVGATRAVTTRAYSR